MAGRSQEAAPGKGTLSESCVTLSGGVAAKQGAGLLRVSFARYMKTDLGDEVRVCGSPKWLGAWDVAQALPCVCQEDEVGLRWSVSVDVLRNDCAVEGDPAFEYKFVRVHADDRGSEWEEGPNRAAVVQHGVAKVTCDDTLTHVRFKIQYQTHFGSQVAVCGSPQELGAWDVGSALRLTWQAQDFWQGECSLPSHFIEEPFWYKFLDLPAEQGAGNDGAAVWEASANRQAHLGSLELMNGWRELWNAWETALVKMSIYYPTTSGEVMAVCGGLEEIGNWSVPRKMVLGREQTLRTNVKGRSWEVAFPMGAPGSRAEYRYVVLPSEGSHATAVWEREPNRVMHLPASAEVPNGIIDVRDVNFVGGMQFDFVPPCLFVGPYPQTNDHIDMLASAGVGGVLNVQTHEDFHQRQINWKSLEEHYYHSHIDARHFPIKDFNPDDLSKKLLEAAGQVHQMVCEGKKVFIHCTAGMGRAPAVAVVYLCRYQNYNFENAHSHVRAHRIVAAPNVGAMRRALGI